MFAYLKPVVTHREIPKNEILPTYKKFRLMTLIGIIIGYACFYIVRDNFALSTPFLKNNLHLSIASVGFLSNYLLLAYGLSKGYMSSFSDKADPKRFMALGLFLCALVNIAMMFSDTIFAFSILAVLLGTFQGMGVGPCFISIATWYPKRERGIIGAIWNTSHNIGGGIVAPIVTIGFFWLGAEHWRAASYFVPAVFALIGVAAILFLVKGAPTNEGLPDLQHIVDDSGSMDALQAKDKTVENMNSWQIFKTYVLPNKNAWFVSFVDTFVYTVRFGMLTWLPIYLLQVKHFDKSEMAVAFLVFEWAAIPSTILSGWISDKLFKGYRMPPAIIAMVLIFFCLIGYWRSNTLDGITFYTAVVGCLIYIPQFLTSVQTMEIVPSYAVGSCVGLRGFMSYIFGASLGTSLFGVAVEHIGWSGGFYILFGAVILTIFFCTLTHLSAVKLHKEALLAQQAQEKSAQLQ